MSIDRSLKKRGTLVRARNVLKRFERIERLKEQDRWVDGQGPFNLPKVRVTKLVTKKATKKEDKGDAAAPAAGAKPAAKGAKK